MSFAESAKPPPFWKRKRWIAVAVLLLAVAYPGSSGPVAYCVGRGWLPMDAWDAIYGRTSHFFHIGGYFGYVMWWHRLGERHATAASN